MLIKWYCYLITSKIHYRKQKFFISFPYRLIFLLSRFQADYNLKFRSSLNSSHINLTKSIINKTTATRGTIKLIQSEVVPLGLFFIMYRAAGNMITMNMTNARAETISIQSIIDTPSTIYPIIGIGTVSIPSRAPLTPNGKQIMSPSLFRHQQPEGSCRTPCTSLSGRAPKLISPRLIVLFRFQACRTLSFVTVPRSAAFQVVCLYVSMSCRGLLASLL